MVAATRRQALLAGAAAALSGCGVQSGGDVEELGPGVPGTSETGRRADAEVLAAALEVKLVAAALYESPRAPRGPRIVETGHVNALTAALTELGGAVPDEGFAVAGADDVLERLREAEENTIAALQDLIPKLSDRDLRSTLAGMLVEDAEQLGAIRRELGAEPAPDAVLEPLA